MYNHQQTTLERLKEIGYNTDVGFWIYGLLEASPIHDIGKLYTQTFDNEGNAHYYNHENVGAYEILTHISYDVPPIITLFVVTIVNYHMKIFTLKTEKSINKWKNIFGEKLYNILELFTEADKYRKEK